MAVPNAANIASILGYDLSGRKGGGLGPEGRCVKRWTGSLRALEVGPIRLEAVHAVLNQKEKEMPRF
jgi:hypothetical protein